MSEGATGSIPRRKALQAAVWATITVAPGRAKGRPSPAETLNLAGVGVGGVGFGHLQEAEQAGFRIAALCDVDDAHARKAYDRWPQARRYRDFREMLHAEGDRIDAVYCGTPDHTHALVTLAALRRRKHVCCVKPLTRTIHEGRVLLEAARRAGVATQMTAAPNTGEHACRTCEWIQAGVLGEVREVHVWSNRPVWPQGMDRPEGEDPVPAGFDWRLWLGPAPVRPFRQRWPEGHLALRQIKNNPEWVRGNRGVYHPFNFRGWWDFGCGALGDMGCHHFNTPFRALRLGAPAAVSATCTQVMPEAAPLASLVVWDFPARSGMPPVRLVWYDGGLQPPVPRGMGAEPLPEEGTLYLGDKGKLLASWDGVNLIPESLSAHAAAVPRTLPRRPGIWGEWHAACRGGEPAGCAFEWAVPLTEAVLLGNVAIRAARPLTWDAAGMRFPNAPSAGSLLREPYHNGWSLE